MIKTILTTQQCPKLPVAALANDCEVYDPSGSTPEDTKEHLIAVRIFFLFAMTYPKSSC